MLTIGILIEIKYIYIISEQENLRINLIIYRTVTVSALSPPFLKCKWQYGVSFLQL